MRRMASRCHCEVAAAAMGPRVPEPRAERQWGCMVYAHMGGGRARGGKWGLYAPYCTAMSAMSERKHGDVGEEARRCRRGSTATSERTLEMPETPVSGGAPSPPSWSTRPAAWPAPWSPVKPEARALVCVGAGRACSKSGGVLSVSRLLLVFIPRDIIPHDFATTHTQPTPQAPRCCLVVLPHAAQAQQRLRSRGRAGGIPHGPLSHGRWRAAGAGAYHDPFCFSLEVCANH